MNDKIIQNLKIWIVLDKRMVNKGVAAVEEPSNTKK